MYRTIQHQITTMHSMYLQSCKYRLDGTPWHTLKIFFVCKRTTDVYQIMTVHSMYLQSDVNVDTMEPLDTLSADCQAWCKSVGSEAKTVIEALKDNSILQVRVLHFRGGMTVKGFWTCLVIFTFKLMHYVAALCMIITPSPHPQLCQQKKTDTQKLGK